MTSATANRQRRGESWGAFYLAPIYTQGVRTGYGAICGLHQNSDDVPGTSCRKALTTGDLPEEECRVRLKRWLMAGLDDKNWPAGQERSLHLSMGGASLSRFQLWRIRIVLRHLKKNGCFEVCARLAEAISVRQSCFDWNVLRLTFYLRHEPVVPTMTVNIFS